MRAKSSWTFLRAMWPSFSCGNTWFLGTAVLAWRAVSMTGLGNEAVIPPPCPPHLGTQWWDAHLLNFVGEECPQASWYFWAECPQPLALLKTFTFIRNNFRYKKPGKNCTPLSKELTPHSLRNKNILYHGVPQAVASVEHAFPPRLSSSLSGHQLAMLRLWPRRFTLAYRALTTYLGKLTWPLYDRAVSECKKLPTLRGRDGQRSSRTKLRKPSWEENELI